MGHRVTKPRHATDEESGIRLFDSAVALLRRAPAGAFAAYYLGAVPFVLGALYFVADMSRAADARLRAADSAFALAAAFVWMKCWQAVFAERLRCLVAGTAMPPATPRRWMRLVARQCAIQPTGLFLLPLALLITMPFPATLAFYQNVTALPADADPNNTAAVRRAARLAGLWQMQNFVLQAVAALFALFVWLNLMLAAVALPYLLRMFTGIETDLSRSMSAVFNTTVVSAALLATYLLVDPVMKAAFVIRCFKGESLTTGEDLRAELRSFTRGAAALGVALMILACGGARAAVAPAPPAPAQVGSVMPVQPAELDRAIDRVLEQPAYRWRLPRDANLPDEEKGIAARFFQTLISFGLWLAREAAWLAGKILDWFASIWPKGGMGGGGGSGSFSFTDVLYPLLFVLLAVLACAVGVLAFRLIKQGRRPALAVTAVPIAARPDIEDEEVSAAQLPEDEWLNLARDLRASGEWRLALRALYLATLAHLAGRELIRLARHKSNFDYTRELRRRAHGATDTVPAFESNVGAFEGAWYGRHPVTDAGVEDFMANLDRIRGTNAQ